ncbi:MAG: type 2 lanthipeptide synthetase LanM [Oscillatoria sp. Prado101]|jgi:type 2 lantibiotic biosynthesis protein LanM|nr:type 2 lanthipeptide synthetase LanM [Oscillatoria sp. Prado101]
MPSWLADLCEAFDRPQNSSPTKIEPKEWQPAQDSSGFLYAVEPLVTLGRERLHQGIEALIAERAGSLSELPFDPNTVETVLFDSLPVRLLLILSRTMALELNVARLQGLLGGETPAERFASFLQRLKDRNVQIALLREYPVLARQLATCIQCWVAASLEFLQRLCADWEEIRALLTAGRDPGVLVRFSDSAGDRHWGGRTVSIAEFSTGFQVVYKPKSLEAGVHFQELLTWVNQQERIPPFPTLKIIARGEYGWVEFVTASSCSSKEEIQKFYQRLGGYLALLYALEAADFHYENLIAAGENPILIDLESLFHPRLKSDSLNRFSLENTLANSVLRAGLLPQRLWASQEFRGVDLSGTGAAPSQLIPGKQPYWEGVATDEMRVGFKPVELRSAQNRPSLNGVPANALDFTEEIVSGFTAIYLLLLEQREELLSAGGSLEKFAASAVRVLVRPTRTYALLLRESCHPDVLRNALDCDRLFDRLWVDVQDRPETAKVLPAERLDLWRGDIPMFVTRANSRDLWASDSRQIADFAAESGMERALCTLPAQHTAPSWLKLRRNQAFRRRKAKVRSFHLKKPGFWYDLTDT